ncbi:phage portal protein [Acuticoccus sp. 2012]|uniref:Phage portal protein n=2 Tax=Acuticoccus mangrovi TaxID=2796142 RepID=A0A934MHN8_9HYPH|nr:phage portal protein [Acuticoccus mangrovi]
MSSDLRTSRETRSSGSGFTAEIIAAREAYISGARGMAELTGTVQTCVTMWESGLALADIVGTDLINHSVMAATARSLALRGEAVWVIREDNLAPATDWEVSTRDGTPRAYRLSIPDAGGGHTETALAAEVLHFRTAVDMVAPWYGSAPLRRARLSAGLLHALETALGEIYEFAPLGSQIVPLPEHDEAGMNRMQRSFRGSRGRVLVRESVAVSAAGGPAPAQDWRPNDLTPDMAKSMALETLEASRSSIFAAFGVLPAMWATNAQGPLVREAQRHLAQWVLQPMVGLMAEEATNKLGTPITMDVVRPTQAFDAGGRARAFATMVQALTQAKEAGLDPQAIEDSFKFIDWE